MPDANRNLWNQSAEEVVDAQPLAANTDADLVIIGGGFTGCAAALAASEHGARVVLLEAEAPGHGGSGRNVGLVNAGLWLPPDEVLEAAGPQDGPRLIDALSAGPQTVFDLIARHEIKCEATRRGTLHLAHAPSGFEDLSNRFRQGNRFGAPLQLLDADETRQRTGSAAFHGALFDPRAGTIQPLAYCRGLARAARDLGAQLHARSAVDRILREDGAWRVEANGYTVRAKALLLATNAYHKFIDGLPSPQFVRVNYCQFATAPLPQSVREEILPGGEGCWDTALVMSSIRTDAAGRLIVGGMGDASGYGRPFHRAWARRKLNSLYPGLTNIRIEYDWSGQIAMTSDHVPKALDIGADALAIFGYSGRGISPGTVFGRAAAYDLLFPQAEPSLPVTPRRTHREQFATAKAHYYEMGATITHGVKAITGT